MADGDSWQAWQQASRAREELGRHLAECPECRNWKGKTGVWIQIRQLTPLPLCLTGAQLARAWTTQLQRARSLSTGRRRKRA